MSFRDYLHEKAEESRHNETLAYLMFLTGAIFFVGSILVALSLIEEPMWFLFIPYCQRIDAEGCLSLSMLVSGVSLMIFGIIAGLNYSRDRNWYMRELRKANSIEEVMVSKKSTENIAKTKKAKA